MDQGRSAGQKGSSSPGLVAIAEIILVRIHCRKELPGNASVRWSL
jgi:hypothetical protein